MFPAHLLALSVCSPFREAQPTGHAAFRPAIFGDLARTGFPEDLDGWSEWQPLLPLMVEKSVCDDASEIHWDVRPAVSQPTSEMRAWEILSRLGDAVRSAALFQCILRILFDLRARDQGSRIYRPMLLEEPKARARWGVEAKLADDGEVTPEPMAELVEELIGLLWPAAEALGRVAEVEHVREIVRRGTSTDIQLRIDHEARDRGAGDHTARREVARSLVEAALADVEV